MAKNNIAIIGGGAAGFFIAANIRKTQPDTQIVIFEKSPKVLAKVKVSGGGRCNLTNSFEEITDLIHIYPRGHRLMKKLFKHFNHQDAWQWFSERGVPLITQEDHCVFPLSQDSESIIMCLKSEAQKNGVAVRTRHEVIEIRKTEENKYRLFFSSPGQEAADFDRIAITTGGSPKTDNLNYLKVLGHKTESSIPSLYTFTLNDTGVKQLMGIVVDDATAWIPGTKFRSNGALLFTHWGMSGPAILKLSSYAARWIHEKNYKFPILINWIHEHNTEVVCNRLQELADTHQQKQIVNIRPFNIPQRLWEYLLQKAGVTPEKKWGEIGKKIINRLSAILTADEYTVNGKGSFREEFVTCGGISLDSISHHTLESKTCPGIFFAGEVLDIDAITGGFNLQAAWTTGYVVAQNILKEH